MTFQINKQTKKYCQIYVCFSSELSNNFLLITAYLPFFSIQVLLPLECQYLI